MAMYALSQLNRGWVSTCYDWFLLRRHWNVEAAPKQTILKSPIFALMKHGYLEGRFFFFFFFWRGHSVFVKWIWSLPSCDYHRRNRQNRHQYWRFTPDSRPWRQQQPAALHRPSATPCRAPCPRQRKHVPSSIPRLKMVDLKNPRVVFTSVGTFFRPGVKSWNYKRSLKTLHLTYLGMLHMLYYMKVKLQIAIIITYNAWVMPDNY